MRKTTMFLSTGGLLLALAAQALAAPKPVAVISFGGYDALKKDVAYAGRLGDNPDLAVGMEAMLKMFTGGKGLAGIDHAKPWGGVVYLEGEEPTGCAFIPVTDFALLRSVFEPFVGEAEETDSGFLKFKTDEGPLFAVEEKGYVFFAKQQSALKLRPKSPGKLLSPLNEQYDLAVQVNVDALPDSMRQKFIAEMKRESAHELERKPHEDDVEYQLRARTIKSILGAVEIVTGDTETLTLGYTLDGDAERAFVEVSMSAKPNTKMAEQFAALGESRTRYSGFVLPDAAMTARWSGQCVHVDAGNVAEMAAAIKTKLLEEIDEEDKSNEEKAFAKELVTEALAIVEGTVASGKADGAMSVRLAPDAVTVVGAGFISDGKKLEGIAKRIKDVLASENPMINEWVTIDADRYKDVGLHTVSVPIPDDADDREKAVRLIGESLDVVVGMGEESIYVAVGRDAMKTLKQAIADSSDEAYRTVPPMQMSMALHPIAEFASVVGDNERERKQAKQVAKLLESSLGRDNVLMTARPIERGISLRIEAEEGILRLLGKVGAMAN
jgi:hypothetical protein